MRDFEQQFNSEEEIKTQKGEKEKDFFKRRADEIMAEFRDIPNYAEIKGLGKNWTWKELSNSEKEKNEELKTIAAQEDHNNPGAWEKYWKETGWKESERELVLDFMTECECLCRHALAIRADNIVLMDKSARGYGYIFHKILPLMRLEQAKLANISFDKIVSPKIRFLNPQPYYPSHCGSQTPEEKFHYLNQNSIDKIKSIFSNKISVIFDETSRVMGKYKEAGAQTHNPKNLTPLEQYKYFDIDNNEDDNLKINDKNLYKERDRFGYNWYKQKKYERNQEKNMGFIHRKHF